MILGRQKVFAALKHACVINPESLPESTATDYEFDYIDIGSVEMSSGIVETERLTFGSAPSRARRIVRSGDVIVSTVRTYLRAIAAVDERHDGAIASTGFAVLRANKGVDQRFLAQVLKSEDFVRQVVVASVGVGYPAINPSTLAAIKIPVPPLEEQRAIAEFLDVETARVDALIYKKKRLANVLDERLGAFLDALTFDDRRFMAHRRRFRWICRAAEGQVDPTVAPWTTMPLVAPNHIESRTGRLIAVETAEEQHAISGKYAFRKGTVLYSKIRPALAKACIAPFDGLCSADMYPLIPTKDIVPEFLLMQLLSRSFTEWAVLESNRVAMPKLNRETLGSAIMVVPPLEEQRLSVERFQIERGKMDRLMSPIRTSVDRLHELRSALITAAVNGQIDPEAWRRRGDTDRRIDRIEADMTAEATE